MKLFYLAVMVFVLVNCSSDDSPSDNSSGSSEFVCTESSPSSNASSPLGSNLPDLGAVNTSMWFFIDAFAKSSQWYASTTSGFDNGSITGLDSDGFPTSFANGTWGSKVLFSNIEGHYPEGIYTLYWEGNGGYVQVSGTNVTTTCSDGGAISSCLTGEATVNISQTDNSGLVVEVIPFDWNNYDGTNYVHDINMIMPGGLCGSSSTDLDYTQHCQSASGGIGSCDSGESCYDFTSVYWDRYTETASSMNNSKAVFHPTTLSHLARYHTLRIMNAFKIIGSTVSAWSERTLLTNHSAVQSNGMGLAPEYAIALANVLDADLWVSVPHQSNDSFQTNFANLVLSQMDSNLDVWVEYTNEHWNLDAEYTQSTYMLTQADANLATLGLSGSESDTIRRARYFAYRTKQIHDLWLGAFGSQSGRIKKVYATSTGESAATASFFDAPNVSATDIDAVAIAPYLGVHLSLASNESTVENLTVNQIVDDLINGSLGFEDNNGGAAVITSGYVNDHQAVVQSYSPAIEIVAYEAGLHLSALGAAEDNQTIQSLFESSSGNFEMRTLYRQYFDSWRNSGAGLMMHFLPIERWQSGFGTFGSMEFEDDDVNNHPRECALREFINSNSCWWSDCTN